VKLDTKINDSSKKWQLSSFFKKINDHAHAHAHAIFISTTTKPLPDSSMVAENFFLQVLATL
jgi:hypothetical protein